MLCPEEIILLTQMIAIAIAQGKTVDELNVLAGVYSQIGSTLAMYAIQKDAIQNCGKDGGSESVLPVVP